MLDKAIKYINNHDVDKSPEELFAEFELAYQLNQEFENYLKENNMQRSLKAMERRKLYVEWYVNKFQDSKMSKQLIMELAELTFSSCRTVERDLFSDTTAQAS